MIIFLKNRFVIRISISRIEVKNLNINFETFRSIIIMGRDNKKKKRKKTQSFIS